MGWFDRLLGPQRESSARVEPSLGTSIRATLMTGPQSFETLDDPSLAPYLRGGAVSDAGPVINEYSAMHIAVANRCVTLISGILATTPADLMLRKDEKTRETAVDNAFRDVLTVRPNRWQTPGEFKRMLQAHKLLRGNGYAYKVRSRGVVRELIPLLPSRVKPVQNADLSITYQYYSTSGGYQEFSQDEIFHLRGLSWDGICGLSVITYAREAMGLASATEKAGSNLYRNGQFTSGYLKSPKKLSDPAYDRLKADINNSAGVLADGSGGIKILEEGLEFEASSLSAKDAEFIGTRGFQRTDVGMFFGVPPHLYGDVSGSTSWGTGIEQQNIGFLQYTMQDHFTAWIETCKRDCLSEKGIDPRLYVHFDLAGLLRADSAGRSAYFSKALGSGGGPAWMTQDEVRSKEDLPPMGGDAAKLPQHGVAVVRDTNADNPAAIAADPAK